jgi:hypothetical protein
MTVIPTEPLAVAERLQRVRVWKIKVFCDIKLVVG